MAQGDGFLSRWSQRKTLARRGAVLPAEPAAAALEAPLVVQPVQAQACLDENVSNPVQHQQPGSMAPAQARLGEGNVSPSPPAGSAQPTPTIEAQPPPTLAEAQALTPASDFSRFVTPDVDPQVKNIALKQLFRDPHFNVMDGLDTYIDDYGKPDPLPASMLRKMVQAHALGLFTEDQAVTTSTAATPAANPDEKLSEPAVEHSEPATPTTPETHEDADLRLQPHHAAGRSGPEPGIEPDAGRAG